MPALIIRLWLLASAQITAAERSAELMRANRVPDLGVGLGLIQQGTRLTDYEVMIEINIPWQTDVIRANVNEAQAMSGAAPLAATPLRCSAV